MSKKNLGRPFTCPMCNTQKPWGDMVKHVAYAGDPQHEQWRIVHDFPARIAFGNLSTYEPKLRIAVVSEFPQ